MYYSFHYSFVLFLIKINHYKSIQKTEVKMCFSVVGVIITLTQNMKLMKNATLLKDVLKKQSRVNEEK